MRPPGTNDTNAHDPMFLKVDGVNYGPRTGWAMFDRGFVFAFTEDSNLTTNFAAGELAKVGKCPWVIKTPVGIYTVCP